MTAVVIVATRQQVIGVGIAAGADHVVNAGAVLVDAVPVQGVEGDRGHGAQVWKSAPQPVPGADVGRVQGARLAAEETFREVVRVPQVQVADLRAFGVDDAEQMPRGDLECPPVPRRHDHFVHQGHALADPLVEGPVPGGHLVHGVDDHRLRRPPGRRIRRFRVLRRNRHGSYLSSLVRTPRFRMLSAARRNAQGCASVRKNAIRRSVTTARLESGRRSPHRGDAPGSLDPGAERPQARRCISGGQGSLPHQRGSMPPPALRHGRVCARIPQIARRRRACSYTS